MRVYTCVFNNMPVCFVRELYCRSLCTVLSVGVLLFCVFMSVPVYPVYPVCESVLLGLKSIFQTEGVI